jgi:hypothetical protein
MSFDEAEGDQRSQHKQDKEYFRCVGSFGAELKNLLFGLLPNRHPFGS